MKEPEEQKAEEPESKEQAPEGQETAEQAAPTPATAAKKRKTEAMVLAGLVVVLAVVATVMVPRFAAFFSSPLVPQEEGRGTMRDVLESLELTDEQQAKRTALIEELDGGYRNPDFGARFQDLLTPEQKQKWQEGIERAEASRQRRSRGRIARSIIEDLELTEDQEIKRGALVEKMEGGMRNPDFWPELEKLLTDKQKEALREGLKRFDAPEQAR